MNQSISTIPTRVPSYYKTRLDKLGITLYDLITYLPLDVVTFGNSLDDKKYNKYILVGQTGPVEFQTKYAKFVINKTTVYDFGRKIKNFMNSLKKDLIYFESMNLEFTLSKSESGYINLVDISINNGKKINYIKARYSPLSYQLGSKQINKIHSYLVDSDYILNLEYLVPKNLNYLIPALLSLQNLHNPNSMEQYNTTLEYYNNFNAFLNLAFVKLNNISNELNILAPKGDKNLLPDIVTEFQVSHDLELSLTQNSTITSLINNLTTDQY